MKTLTHLSLITLPGVLLLANATLPPGAGDPEIELDEAEVFIEFNSTDEDFGIQFFWDGEPWDRMTVEDPDGKKVLRVKVKGAVKEQGLTEGFFESAEPSADELSMEEFLERFPAGTYGFQGDTLEGEDLVGETAFTHVMPAPPANLYPADEEQVDAGLPLVVSFDAVTTDLDGNPLQVELYEAIVEQEGEDLLRVFSIVLPGDAAAPAVEIPAVFLNAGETYKFEVIAQEESGNRTISETEFETF